VKPVPHAREAALGVRVSVLSAVAQPCLLSGVGGEGDDRTGEDGAGERGAPAADSGNHVLGVGEPVGRAEPKRSRDVGDDVDDHQHAPDSEADGVHAEQ
jgi:hypothetical protein